MWQELQPGSRSMPTVARRARVARRMGHAEWPAFWGGVGAVFPAMPPLGGIGLPLSGVLVAAAAGTGSYVARRRGRVLTFVDFVAQLPSADRAEALAYLESVDRTSEQPDLFALGRTSVRVGRLEAATDGHLRSRPGG